MYVKRIAIVTFVVLSVALATHHTSHAQTVWTAGTGNWNTPSNWSLGVPNSASPTAFDAIVTNGGTAQLLTTGASVRRLRIGTTGAGNLQVTGGGLTVTEDLHINEGAGGTSSVSVTAGSAVTAPSTVVGYSSGTTSSLLISGAGTTYNAATEFIVGRQGGGTATLNIQSGGVLTTNVGQLGNFATATTGNATVTDANSRWSIGGNLALNRGTLTIENQGTVFVGSDIVIGSVGTIHLNGGGTLRFDTLSSGLSLLVFSGGTIQLAGDRTIGTDVVINSRFAVSPVIPSGKGLTVEGTATLPAGSLVTLSGGALTAGTILMSPGSRITTTQASSAVGAVIMPAGSVIDATGGDLVLGNSTKVNGFYSNGTLSVGNSTVTLADANDAVFDSAALATLGSGASPGTLNAANGLTLDFGGNITGFGTLSMPNNITKPLINNGHITGSSVAQPITLPGYVKGVGTFDNVNLTGTFAPGLSPTTLTVGNVALSPTSTLIMELGGTVPGSGHDQVRSSAALAFDGMLQVSLINGFSPAAGQSFDLFDWASASGTFANINLPVLAGLAWNISQLYTTGVLSVRLAGDYNGNGTVDAADYVVWRKGLGTKYTPDDYYLWRDNFGHATDGGAGASTNAAVPEPATLDLLIVGMLMKCYRRRAIVS